MSTVSLAALRPRAANRVPARWFTIALPVVATVAAVYLAVLAWLYGNQPIRSDAQGYYDLALPMASEGPLAFESTFRTYGYPAFLALLIRIVGPTPETVRTAGFAVQLTLFILAAWVGSSRLSRALGIPGRAPWIYAATVFSPFILIHAMQMLTDVLSATLVYLAVVLSVPTSPADADSDARRTRRTVLLGMFAMLLIGLAVIIRPSNLVLLPAVLLAWLIRALRFGGIPWRTWPVLLAMLALPFVPQMVFNYRAYGVPHPLLVTDLYTNNSVNAMRTAKYATMSIAGVPSRLYYNNPFGPPENVLPLEYLQQEPLKFAATLCLHLFGLFDHDFPFTYITDPNPWYRWHLAVPNYLFLLLGFGGLLVGFRRPPGETADVRRRARFTFGLVGITIGLIVAIYLPVLVENRYSLPVYPLLAAPFVVGVERLRGVTRGRPLVLGVVLLGAALYVGGMVATSLWLDTQAPLLQNVRATLATALPPSPTASYRVQAPESWEPGQMVTIPVTVTNTGPDTWSLEGLFNVTLRVQIQATKTEQHRLLPKGARVYVLPTRSIAPGESADFLATVETPTATGRYILTVTMIRTGIDEPGPGFERPIRVDKKR